MNIHMNMTCHIKYRRRRAVKALFARGKAHKAHVSMSHVTHNPGPRVNESRHTYECVMSHKIQAQARVKALVAHGKARMGQSNQISTTELVPELAGDREVDVRVILAVEGGQVGDEDVLSLGVMSANCSIREVKATATFGVEQLSLAALHLFAPGICVCKCVHTHTCMCMSVCAHTYTCACAFTYTHVYVYTYM